MANVIFGSNIDYNRVDFKRSRWRTVGIRGSGGRTIGDNIYVNFDVGDDITGNKYFTQILMHELAHVWQRQNDIHGGRAKYYTKTILWEWLMLAGIAARYWFSRGEWKEITFTYGNHAAAGRDVD